MTKANVTIRTSPRTGKKTYVANKKINGVSYFHSYPFTKKGLKKAENRIQELNAFGRLKASYSATRLVDGTGRVIGLTIRLVKKRDGGQAITLIVERKDPHGNSVDKGKPIKKTMRVSNIDDLPQAWDTCVKFLRDRLGTPADQYHNSKQEIVKAYANIYNQYLTLEKELRVKDS